MSYLLFSKEQYKDAFANTTETLQRVSISTETSKRIADIAERNSAAANVGSIAAAVGYTLAGMLPIRLLIEALKEETGLPEQTVQTITQDIRREILAPVAHDLAAMQPQAEQNYAAIQTAQNPTQSLPPQSSTPPATS